MDHKFLWACIYQNMGTFKLLVEFYPYHTKLQIVALSHFTFQEKQMKFYFTVMDLVPIF